MVWGNGRVQDHESGPGSGSGLMDSCKEEDRDWEMDWDKSQRLLRPRSFFTQRSQSFDNFSIKDFLTS
jgi:hypothetical protein